jgi:hypothetical protein
VTCTTDCAGAADAQTSTIPSDATNSLDVATELSRLDEASFDQTAQPFRVIMVGYAVFE